MTRNHTPTDAHPFGGVIHTYGQAQAFADGVLIAVDPELSREAGLRIPVVLTASAHADCVLWTEEDDKRKGGTGQDETGRMWDVLYMTAHALRAADHGQRRVDVELWRVPTEGRGVRPRPARLIAKLGFGDEGEPRISVMLPGES